MIGIDIVSIKRIDKAYRKYGERFLSKFLSSGEISLAKNSQSIAGFFAAKEAFSKAIGCGVGREFSFCDIIIAKTSKNAPFLQISPKILSKFSIKNSSLSISHDGDFAIAVVLLQSDD